jgi:uncharacterized protein YkwD
MVRRVGLRRALLAAFRTALLLAGGSAAGPTVAQPAEPLVVQVADLINAYRKDHGLGPLVDSADLSALAAEHSHQMAGVRQLSHAGFQARFQRSRSNVCVENVAFGFSSAERLVQGWRASPAHHRNLLEPKVARMGLAATGHYLTFFACR